ncbi:MAG: EAL domain-containing protein [Pseudomonadota bacterium]
MMEGVTIAIAVALLGGLGLYARHRHRNRLSRLNDQLLHITEGKRFEKRLSATGEDEELSRLVDTVNRMFEVLDSKDRGLAEREDLFRNLAESVQESIVVHRDEIIYCNPRAASLRGKRQADLLGKPALDLVHPDERERAGAMIRRRLAGEDVPGRYEMQMLNRDGDGYWVEASGVVIDYQGEPAILTAAFDITLRKEMEAALAREKERAQVTLESIGEGVITTDTTGAIDYMNVAAMQLAGCGFKEARGKRLTDIVRLVDETDRKPLRDPVATCLGEGRRVNLGKRALMVTESDNKELSVELSVSPIRALRASQLLGTVIVLHDVTELRGLARQMSYQASHDALTGLYNRPEFERRLEEALESARDGGQAHVLCYLDLDRFKAVNDTCGHIAGDNMLREVASLIKDKVRDSDSVARIGGDEFGMLLIGCPLQKARQIADDVCAAVADYRFVWRDRVFNIGISIGLVEIAHESGTMVEALSAADSACYIAKQQGRGQVRLYSARDEATARHSGEIAWLQRLQQAIKGDEFEIFVQPVVSVGGRVPDGPAFEVLLRMPTETGTVLTPTEFLQSAERYQLMPGIDRWVIKTTLAAISAGALKLPDRRACAINLSGQSLGDPQILDFVVEALDRSGVSPERICFEVKESAVFSNLGHARRFVEVLHGIGCQFALDDFGSGVGSFANLKALSMDYLKIDGALTRNLDGDEVNQTMVAAMIDLARTLDIQVIAEQVEDQSSLQAIRSMGVNFVQGYVIGRPRPLQSHS